METIRLQPTATIPLRERYALVADGPTLRDVFYAALSIPLQPRYNIAPTQWAPVVRMSGSSREVVLMSWGLKPRPRDAAGETLLEDCHGPHLQGRCLVPATGFYKWAELDKGSPQPYFIHYRARGLMAFAGTWEQWFCGEESINAFSILETVANERVRPFAERMPVILGPESWEEWLDPATAPERIGELRVPCAAGCLDLYPVSRYLDNPAHDNFECMRRVESDSL